VDKSFDAAGREVIDDPTWQQARAKVDALGIDAGMIAGMMRLHRNEVQRATAFYAAFYCSNIGYVMELISHIPGEPVRSTREAAFPRAIQFMRAHLGKRYGQLTDDEKALVVGALPAIGSPAAKAQGLTRLPSDNDHLHSLRLVPFFQLLDVDDELDRAQALWFIKETIVARTDFANLWLEPALPRLRQLLRSDNNNVRDQATAIFQLIAAKDAAPPPQEIEALVAWAKAAGKNLFPPIRNINDAIVQLYPSDERDTIAKAGIKALENSSIGDFLRGQRKDGSWYSGFRVGRVPDALVQLAIQKGSVITSVNGAPVGSAQELLAIIIKQSKAKKPRRVMVEYVLKGQSRAIEDRIMERTPGTANAAPRPGLPTCSSSSPTSAIPGRTSPDPSRRPLPTPGSGGCVSICRAPTARTSRTSPCLASCSRPPTTLATSRSNQGQFRSRA
jgi:hypothetical protein